MLTIRREQFQAFAEVRLSAFKRKLMADLSVRLAAAGRTLDEAERRQELDRGITAAQLAGFDRECDIAQYVLIIATHFGCRWSEPLPGRAAMILFAEGIPPERRLATLDDWARDMKGIVL